jgi:methylmalonyl-CoA mutase C-terminal domain/subunit
VTGRIRVVVSEPGPDGGVPGLARALRDAGMEVIYAGSRQTPEQIVQTALQEDADVIGLAVGPGTPPALLAELVELLARRDAEDVLVFAATVEPGGVDPAPAGPELAEPEPAEPELADQGGATVFAPGTGPERIVDWVRDRSGSP